LPINELEKACRYPVRNDASTTLVIAGLDPAIHPQARFRAYAATLSIATVQHGCADQARA
jgi:hypothetical protein